MWNNIVQQQEKIDNIIKKTSIYENQEYLS